MTKVQWPSFYHTDSLWTRVLELLRHWGRERGRSLLTDLEEEDLLTKDRSSAKGTKFHRQLQDLSEHWSNAFDSLCSHIFQLGASDLFCKRTYFCIILLVLAVCRKLLCWEILFLTAARPRIPWAATTLIWPLAIGAFKRFEGPWPTAFFKPSKTVLVWCLDDVLLLGFFRG